MVRGCVLMIYFIILLNGISESYGMVRGEKSFQYKKELLEDFGCEVKKVSRREYEKVKKKIDFENFVNRKCFKVITGGETM